MRKLEGTTRSWGEWAFFIGVILAIVLGFFSNFVASGTTGLVLVLLGLIVGFVNITRQESQGFLIAAIALLLVGNAGLNELPSVGFTLDSILLNIGHFVAPAALVVALKAVVDLAKKA